MPGLRIKKNKNASVFSHEFIITNHGDIVSCICMLFMFGLMLKSTQKIAGVFIAPQYNITKLNNDSNIPDAITYTVGRKDICTIFFYSMAWIVVHAIIQEYILDKINRKFHLSKTKIGRFNNMGGHIPFFFASVAWGADIILKENLLPKVSNIWDGYPHTEMTFMVKFYFILQIAYWIHCFPELYFLKAKKEDIFPRIRVYLQYIACIVPAYIFNFSRLALICLVIHYSAEFLLYTIKIMCYMGKTEGSKNQFMVLWGFFYTIARILIIMVAVVTFMVGLPKQDSADDPLLIPNFNQKPARIILLTGIILMQAWLVWQFISYQVHYWGDVFQSTTQKAAKKKEQKKAQKKALAKEEQKKALAEDGDDQENEEMPVPNGKYKTS